MKNQKETKKLNEVPKVTLTVMVPVEYKMAAKMMAIKKNMTVSDMFAQWIDEHRDEGDMYNG